MLTLDWEGLYTISILTRSDAHWANTAGCKRDRRAAPQPPSPLGGTRTDLTEPCGALPRKDLFIYELGVEQSGAEGASLLFAWCR
jgi:hypothetical protein